MMIDTCPKCKKPVLPHIACRFCGTYAGRQVLPAKLVEAGKALKKAEKAAAAKHDHADHKGHDHPPQKDE